MAHGRGQGPRQVPAPDRVAGVLGAQARHDDPRDPAGRGLLVDGHPRAVREADRRPVLCDRRRPCEPEALGRGAQGACGVRGPVPGQSGTYGKVEIVNWGAVSKTLPADTFDFILTARSIHGWMQQGPNVVAGNVRRVPQGTEAGRHPGRRAASGESRPAGAEKPESGYVSEQYVIEQADEGRLQARGPLGDQCQPQGHQGPSVRRLDAAADAALVGLRLGPAGRPEVRPQQVPRDRRVRPHDAEVRQELTVTAWARP